MSWDTAIAWVAALSFRQTFLGVWRSQLGPGPFSIYVHDGKRVLELWARGDGQFWGKRL